MVKNRLASEARADVSLEVAREKEGRLFEEKEWTPSVTGLDPSRMGINELRRGLSRVFCSHIRTEFRALNEQTRLKLGSTRAKLENLGKPRGVLSQQRTYLKSVVSAYQFPKHEFLSNNRIYDIHSSRGGLHVRLALLKKQHLRDKLDDGAIWRFKTPKPDKDEDSDKAACRTDIKSTKSTYTWINNRYQSTKSRFLPGTLPYPLLEQLFVDQTANWAEITRWFVEEARVEFNAVVVSCLQCACYNKQVSAELEKLILSAVEAKLGTLMDFCLDLIKDEQNSLQVVASEPQFLSDIREARALRLMSAISRLEDESQDTKTSTFADRLFGGLHSGSRPNTESLFANINSGGSSSSSKPTSGGLFGGSTTAGLSSRGSSFGGTATDDTGSTPGTYFGISPGSNNTTTAPTTSSNLFDESNPFGNPSNSTKRNHSSGLFGSTSSNTTTTNPVDSGPTMKPTGTFGGGFGSSKSTGMGFGTANTTSSASGARGPSGGLFGSSSSAASEATPRPPKPLTDFAKTNQSAFRDIITHERQIVYELHDILKAYYSTSVQHYVNSVCKNGLNQLFIEETMDVFSDSFVDALPDREVERIAAESVEDRRRRRKLRDEISGLEGVIAESEAILREVM